MINERQELYTVRETIKATSKTFASKIGFDFSEELSLNDFVVQILFCCVKDAKTNALPRQSISYFEKQVDEAMFSGDLVDEDTLFVPERVKKKRKQVLDRNEEDIQRLGIEVNPYAEQLRQIDSTGRGRFPGYHYNELDYLALKNTSRNKGLRIASLLEGGRITEAKKVSGETIKDAYGHYAEYLRQQSQVDDSAKWLYNLFDVASIETNMAISFIYALACYMETTKMETLPEQVILLCSVVSLLPLIPRKVESRFLARRNSLIPFVCKETEDNIRQYFFQLLHLHSAVLSTVIEDERLCDSIKQIPERQLADYFRETYNLFDVSFPADNFTASFVKKLREAARTIMDSQLYQRQT